MEVVAPHLAVRRVHRDLVGPEDVLPAPFTPGVRLIGGLGSCMAQLGGRAGNGLKRRQGDARFVSSGRGRPAKVNRGRKGSWTGRETKGE